MTKPTPIHTIARVASIATLALLLPACASLPDVRLSPPSSRHAFTSPGPDTCPHPGVIWSRWQEQPIGSLTKLTRTRHCNHCPWAQTQSMFKETPP